MFGVGRCDASCFAFFVKNAAINCFGKIQMVLRRTYKFISSGPDRTDCRQLQ